jgi:hypothetical protein|tara:strand:+ start:2007 stop:3050 length:1044 start_codon:yes stop_codon:yes gene_type:complete
LKIAIIGAGLFGCSIAIKIKEKYKKYKVTIFEKNSKILYSASGKNQFRCHMGYHYPRSTKTISECKSSTYQFEKYYKDCFIDSENYYAISNKNSKVSFNEYLDILEKNKLPFKIQPNKIFNYKNIEASISVKEKIIDINKVRKATQNYFKKFKINLKLNYKIDLTKSFLNNYDIVYLATYDNNNNNTKNLITKKEKYFYQLVEKIIVKTPKPFHKFSAVVLDGPFMCIDPYSLKGHSILGNVKKSILLQKNQVFNNIYDTNLSQLNKYLIKYKSNSKFKNIIEHMSKYFNYTENIKYYGSFYVIRCTRKNKNDERLTKITNNNNLIQVFSGKWVNCFNTASKVLKFL